MNCRRLLTLIAFGIGVGSYFDCICHAVNLKEGWENARVGFYVPDETTKCLIRGDMGTWIVAATIDGEPPVNDEPDCGPIPHEVEIISISGDNVLRLTSGQSDQGCSDNIWAVLFTNLGSPINNHITIPIKPTTTISFEENGYIDDPEQTQGGYNCFGPPCYDSISVQVEDTAGNVVAYVIQRYSDAEPVQSRSHYYEIHLDPNEGSYSRNLYDDFSLIPTFNPATSKIYTVEVQIDEHGWCVVDNISIDGATSDPNWNWDNPTGGDLDLNFAGKLDIWDISGNYTSQVGDVNLVYTLAQDVKGKITGSGTADRTPFVIKGSVKQKNGVATIKLAFKGNGFSLKMSKGNIDAESGQITGEAKVAIEGRKFMAPFTATLSENMDGSSVLYIHCSQSGKNLLGTAELQLPNGETIEFDVKGKYNDNKGTCCLTLKGREKGNSLRINIGNDGQIISLKGKVLGQSLKIE